MKKFLNNLREPITSIIGLVIIGITLYSIYTGTITWMWEGTVGVFVGCLFFAVPDRIVKIILDTFNKLLKSNNDTEPNG